MMVTFSYFAIFTLLALLATLFDMKIFDFTFWEALRNLLFSEVATGRMIILFTIGAGLVSSLIIDYRIFKNRKKTGSF
ncbi:hypothetical protein [Cytobacillus oceanisediminis]|jgi:hypothetical protein|uniref:hypothetical protein n=1 Tax=Cytobacillus oceanisediminis TaxID=665099 RepID=UPI00215B0816|nr:hypothetical protein [Cytobacillus oceanisediminis]